MTRLGVSRVPVPLNVVLENAVTLSPRSNLHGTLSLHDVLCDVCPVSPGKAKMSHYDVQSLNFLHQIVSSIHAMVSDSLDRHHLSLLRAAFPVFYHPPSPVEHF